MRLTDTSRTKGPRNTWSTNVETGSASYVRVRTERPTNLKLGTQMEYEDPQKFAPVSRSKVKVTRSTNAETGSGSYLLNGKAYELLKTWYTDVEQRPVSTTSTMTSKSKVKVARSRDASDRCWPISQEQKVP